MDRQLHFVSGLPRSGTTLLMNLLGQCPNHHVTPTSGLVHLVRHIVDHWTEIKEFRSQGLDQAKPFVLGGLKGLMHGFFDRELTSGKAVFDKSRGWIQYIEPLEEVLGRRVRVITMVRDVRSIVASFEKIYRRRGIEYRPPDTPANDPDSVVGRARHTLETDQVTGRSLLRLRDALQRCPDRLVIIPYRRFTESPREAMKTIHQVLDLPPFDYDPDHVKQITYEDDNVNGMDLHRIRPQIEPTEEAPWESVLPDDFAAELAVQYDDINSLAAGPIVADRENA